MQLNAPKAVGSPATNDDVAAAFPGLSAQPPSAPLTAVGTASSDAAAAVAATAASGVAICGGRDPWDQLEASSRNTGEEELF